MLKHKNNNIEKLKIELEKWYIENGLIEDENIWLVQYHLNYKRQN